MADTCTTITWKRVTTDWNISWSRTCDNRSGYVFLSASDGYLLTSEGEYLLTKTS